MDLKCNRCGGTMTRIYDLREAWSINAKFDVEICTHCNHIWFDQNEQSYMSREALAFVAKILVERANPEPIKVPKTKSICCEKCNSQLIPQKNLINSQPFVYDMCPNECGVFLSFEDFLKLHSLIRKPRSTTESTETDNDTIEEWEKESILINVQKLLETI